MQMRTPFIRFFPLLLIVITLSIHIFVSVAPANSLVNWFTIDDAYYYFKVAQNVSEGLGFTFDGINTASGFHPLWMFICIPIFAIARYDLLLPLRILVIVAGVFNAASGVLLFATFRRFLALPVAALLSFFWIISPLTQPVISHNGMEAGINAFSIILFMYLLIKHETHSEVNGSQRTEWLKLFWLGAAGVLVLLSRLDNIFFVFAVGVWLIYRKNNERYPILILILISVASVFVSYFLRVGFREAYIQYMSPIYWMLVTTLIIKMSSFALAGLFDLPRTEKVFKDIVRVGLVVTLSSILSGAIILLIYRLGVFDQFPRSVILIDWVITLAGAVILMFILHLTAHSSSETVPAVSDSQQLKLQLQIWWRRGSAFFAPIMAALGIYLLWNKLTFDTFTPVSGQIKHWWGTLYTVYGKPVNSLAEFFGYDARLKRGPWSLSLSGWTELAEKLRLWKWIGKEEVSAAVGYMFLVFVGIYILLLVFNYKSFRSNLHNLVLLPLVAGSFLQLFYYNGTGYVNTRDWYWISQMLVIIWLAAIFADLLYQRLRAWKIPAAIPVTVMLIIGVAWFFGYGNNIVKLVPPVVVPENEVAYMGAIQLLEQATEPGAIIGSTGGGNMAYFIQDRTIINLDGLMNSSAYFKSMQNGTAADFLDKMGMDYVYANAYMVTKSDPYGRMFAGRLQELDTFASATLFRYICKECK